jgi:hypothetical protein
MISRKNFVLMAALALMAINSVAFAGIVDPANSFATLATSPGIMLVAPGGAESFTIPNNYQIDVYLNDSGNNPVEVIATDIWLDDPIVVWCAGGVIADSSTFAPDPGHTTFTGTPRGGVVGSMDCSLITLDVVAVGNIIEDLALAVCSPDLNGDGHVTVADFGLFAGAFQGTDACADFNRSGGDVTVADFGIFAGYFNISDCP